MTRVLEFCQSPSNPFEKLVRQEQLLHCNSIHAHLTNSRVNVLRQRELLRSLIDDNLI